MGPERARPAAGGATRERFATLLVEVAPLRPCPLAGHVGDVVGALMKLMDDDRAIGQVFNVGSDQEITIMDLAKKVKQLTNSESEIVLVPYDEAYEEGFEDMPRRVPDISKSHKQVGFAPKIDLDGILRSVIDFHSGQNSQEKRSSAAEG